MREKVEAGQPTLLTPRLRLRPLQPADASFVQELAGAKAVAEMTLLIPHPYPDGVAQNWIAQQEEEWRTQAGAAFAIERLETSTLCGAIGLKLNVAHRHAELGYWLGIPFWGKGYCTEAGQSILRFAFCTLGLHRVFAQHFARNPASGRVLQKLGMQHEGCLRQHLCRGGQFEDSECYGILRPEWERKHSA